LTRLTVRNGKTDAQGAGILNFGRLTLVRCTVRDNATTESGGGIENKALLTLSKSTVSGNSASFGGGIDNDDARLVATNSVIAGNTGSGIVNRGGSLKLTRSTIRDNVGIGISEDRNGGSTLDRVRITSNTGGGYALSQGATTISHSTIAGNSGSFGAGIGNFVGGHLTVSKSTIRDNTASGDGGGIYNHDDPAGRVRTGVLLVNSTVIGNSAESGGGIMSDANGGAFVTVDNSTIVSNTARVRGGGVAGFAFEFGGAGLTNSIVARNAAPTGPDVFGEVGASFTLIGDGSDADITNTDGNKVGNVSPIVGAIDPRLGPLADNGGPTRTLALLAGSPAIDAASADRCPGKDQRDVARPRGTACDMGSVER
jgi:hypothetical protein